MTTMKTRGAAHTVYFVYFTYIGTSSKAFTNVAIDPIPVLIVASRRRRLVRRDELARRMRSRQQPTKIELQFVDTILEDIPFDFCLGLQFCLDVTQHASDLRQSKTRMRNCFQNKNKNIKNNKSTDFFKHVKLSHL